MRWTGVLAPITDDGWGCSLPSGLGCGRVASCVTSRWTTGSLEDADNAGTPASGSASGGRSHDHGSSRRAPA